MRPEEKKQVAKALLDAAEALSASSGSATLRVWHGTDAMFDDFDLSKAGSRDPGWLGRGLYFSTDPRVAQGFKRQVQATVRLKNPLMLKMPDWKTDKFNVAREALGLPFERGITDAGARALTAEAQRRGFDGVILDYSPAGYFHQEVVAFHPKSVTITSSGPVSASSQVARKDNGRPRGTFVGSADGWEYTEGYPLGLRGGWAASIGLSSSNDWMNLSVDGATEYDDGFRNALREIVAEYPEVAQYVVSFDGPYIPVSELLEMKSKDFRDIVFLHGTSSAVVPRIMAEGLRPRSETGIEPAYGHASSAKPSIPDRVYLTTQPAMATFAARSAARVHGGEPVVLEVTGLDPSYALPDEDSRAQTAEESLARLGSIAYSRTIPTSKIRAVNGKLSAATLYRGEGRNGGNYPVWGFGLYLTDNPEVAATYGDVKEYDVDVSKTWDGDAEFDSGMIARLKDFILKSDWDLDAKTSAVKEIDYYNKIKMSNALTYQGLATYSVRTGDTRKDVTNGRSLLNDFLKSEGFTGIRYPASGIHDEMSGTAYVMFPGVVAKKLSAATGSDTLFHGSKKLFTEFSADKIGTSQRGPGIFFSNSEKYAKVFGPVIYKCKVSLKNPKLYYSSMDFQVDVLRSGDDVTALYRSLKESGHDGIIIQKSKVSTGTVKEVIAFSPDSVEIVSVTGTPV